MNNWLTKSADLLDSAKNLVKTFGGYLVSQSESTSQAYARHQLRLAHVHAVKELMTEEAKSVARVRDSLRQRFLDADPDTRLRIRRDLESTEGELQRLAVYSKGADYLPEFANKIRFVNDGHDQSHAFDGDAGTTDHWIDRFNDLARVRLEPWRQDLLARALAAEATAPGIVTLRALWAIGLLDHTKFQAFSILLDLCSFVSGGYVIPQSSHNIIIPECELGTDIRLGQLIYQLNDTEILGYRDSHQHHKKGEIVEASYRSQRFTIRSERADWTVRGVGPSVTGKVISLFYDQRESPIGKQIFDTWLEGLRKQQFQIEPLPVEPDE